MNQCVPSWNLDENSNQSKIKFHAHSNSSNYLLPDVPSMDYEVAELTWENGQLAMHGLGVPRVANKPTVSSSPMIWDKPRATGGTLESIVNQATHHPQPKPAVDGGGDHTNELVPWFDHHRAMVNPGGASGSITMTVDALVPCNNNIRRNNNSDNQEPSSHVQESVGGMGISRADCSTRVGSCSGAAPTLDGGGGGGGGRPHRVARVGTNRCKTNGSVSESATCGGRDSHQVTLDTWERELGGTSLVSPENTISGQEYTKTSADDHDFISHSRPQARHKKAGDEEGKRKGIGKSSVSTKRSRAAAIHNQSERKRRDKINQRMKTLQKLVPNSSKTDKASMLDEVIEYLKQLQAQVHMMSRMNIPSMMLPLAMQQQLQMSMMGMGMGMGMGVMDMNSINRAAAVPPVMPPPAAFMPVPPVPWDNPGGECLRTPPAGSVMPDPLAALLACQSQPMTMDAYSRLAAMYQQLQQPPVSKN